MLARLFSVVVLLSTAFAVENPCKGKQTTGCEDIGASCPVIFPQDAGSPNQKCFDTSSPDNVFADNCHKTCQLCCKEFEFSRSVDPDDSTTIDSITTEEPTTATEQTTTLETTNSEASSSTTEDATSSAEPSTIALENTSTASPITSAQEITTSPSEASSSTIEDATSSAEPSTSTLAEEITTTPSEASTPEISTTEASTTIASITTEESIITTVDVVLSTAYALENPCQGKQTTGCDDIGASCAVIFPKDAGSPNQNCFDTSSPDNVFANNCHKTCQLCCKEPEFDCSDDPIPNMDCPTTEAECNQLSDFNFLHCKSSCGWCDLKAKPCLDTIGADKCASFKSADGDLCSMPEVSVQCEKTCGVCIPENCVDTSVRCAVWAANGFCEDPFYTAVDTASTTCKRTCDLC